jgi:predicted exporter
VLQGKRRLVVILYYLLPALLLPIIVWQVHFKTDITAFFMAGEGADEVIMASEIQSGKLSRRYLVSVVDDRSQSISATFMTRWQESLQAIPLVTEVWVPGRQTIFSQDLLDYYARHANGIYSLTPEADLQTLFSESGLNQRAQWIKELLLSSQAALIKPLLLHDPLLLTLSGFQSLAGQLQTMQSQSNAGGNLILETAIAGMDVPQQQIIQNQIKQRFQQLCQSLNVNYQLQMTGVPIFAVATETLLKGDIMTISVFSSLLLAGLFLALFRSFQALAQVFTLLLIVIGSSVLMTEWFFGYVHGMTVAIGSTLVGICIDYPIHALAHGQSVPSDQRTGVIQKIWPSMLLGGLTTLVGYVALGSSGYPGFQQVTIYAANGILVSLLLTRFILPQLMTPQKQQTFVIYGVISWLRCASQWRRFLLMALLVGVAGAIYNVKHLRWLQDLQELTPEINVLKQQDREIRARMTSIEPGRFLLVMADDTEGALQKTEQLYGVLEKLRQQKVLQDYTGVYPWVLSERQQQINRTVLQTYLTDDNLAIWQKALKNQGLSVQKLGHFSYATSDAINLDSLSSIGLRPLLDSHILQTEGHPAVIMIWLAEHDYAQVQKAVEAISGVRYFSHRDVLNRMTQETTQQAKQWLSLGLGFISLILIGHYRSIKKAVLTLLPACLAAILILGLWVWFDVAVSFLHLVGFLLVIAICVDYGIFFQENRSGNLILTYQAMAASMLTSVGAFGSLLTADSYVLRILAGVVALGVLLGFVLCPLVIPKSKSISRCVTPD